MFGLVVGLSNKGARPPFSQPSLPAEFPFNPGVAYEPRAMKVDHIESAVKQENSFFVLGELLCVQRKWERGEGLFTYLFISMKIHYCNCFLPSLLPILGCGPLLFFLG